MHTSLDESLALIVDKKKNRMFFDGRYYGCFFFSINARDNNNESIKNSYRYDIHVDCRLKPFIL